MAIFICNQGRSFICCDFLYFQYISIVNNLYDLKFIFPLEIEEKIYYLVNITTCAIRLEIPSS